MGGKSKSQRTKNNARPSSSGRSAELLHNAANLDKSIFGGLKTSPLFGTLAPISLEQGLSTEFSVCLKKLNKKDPITKTKALQELNDLVNKSKLEETVAALPSWAYFYKVLSVDTDCKVREAAQACHASVARACGRQLAPALRVLVPAWLQAQCDDHAPAQALAEHSLTSTFPENKLPDVISFCKNEVIAHLMDNLIGNAERTLTKRAESQEEREMQMERIVMSSLHGLQYFARRLPETHRDWLWEQLAPLLDSNAFWKLATGSQRIRPAWFALMGSLVEQFEYKLADKYGARLVRVLAAGAHDTNSSSSSSSSSRAPQLWACLLQLMYTVPDWYKYLDKKDLLAKKIVNMLEKGGWGDARRLGEMWLPLLAHLPSDLLTRGFYESFFDAYLKGLETKHVITSRLERQHWISSLSECMQFFSIQPHEYVVEVITAVHRKWLQQILSTGHEGQVRSNLIKHSATNMGALVKFWLKQSREANGEKFDQLVRNYWQNIGATVLKQLDQPDLNSETVVPILEGHILLLQTLKTAATGENKKQLSIKFSDDKPPDESPEHNHAQNNQSQNSKELDASSAERYRHNLLEIVEKVCCAYLEFADKRKIAEPILNPMITILNDFAEGNLFEALARHFECPAVYDFYEKVLMKWLLCDEMRCQAIVDVTFIVMKHLTEEEQDAVLNSFGKLPPDAVEWCVNNALCHVHWQRPAVRRWLRGPLVQGALLALCRRLLLERRDTRFYVCLSVDHTGEMLISESTASMIAEEVSAAVRAAVEAPAGPEPAAHVTDPVSHATDPEPVSVSHAAGVAAHVATALAGPRPPPAYMRLLLDLLRLLWTVARGSGALGAESWCEVRSALHDGACALAADLRTDLRRRAADDMHQRLQTLYDKVSTAEIEHMTSLCPYLLSECDDREPPSDLSEVIEFTSQLVATPDHDANTPAELFALRHDCIVNNLNCPFDDDNPVIGTIMRDATENDPQDLTKEILLPYVNKILFRAMYLKVILLNKGRDDDDDDVNDIDSESDDRSNLEKDSNDAVKENIGEVLEENVKSTESKEEDKNRTVDKKIEGKDNVCQDRDEKKKEAKNESEDMGSSQETNNKESDKLSRNQSGDDEVEGSKGENEKSEENKEVEETQGTINTVEESKDRDMKGVEEVKEKEEEEEQLQRKYNPWCNTLLRNDYMQSTFCNLLYEIAVVEALKEAYSFWIHYDLIEEASKQLEGILQDIVGETTSEVKTAILDALSDRAVTLGYYWSMALAAYKHKCLQASTRRSPAERDLPRLEEMLTGNGFFHTLQAELRWQGASAERVSGRFALMVRNVLLAYESAARDPEFTGAALRACAACDLDPVVRLYHAPEPRMLVERDIMSMPWREVLSEVSVAECVREVLAGWGAGAGVGAGGWHAPPHHWDLATVSLCALLANLAAARDHAGCVKVAMMCNAAMKLYEFVAGFVWSLPAECKRRQPAGHIADLMGEWRDVFGPALTRDLLALALTLIETATEEVCSVRVRSIAATCAAVRRVDWALLEGGLRAGRLGLRALAAACGQALARPLPPACHALAYTLGKALAGPLAKRDAEAMSAWEGGDTPRPQLFTDWFHAHYIKAVELLDAALTGLEPGIDVCEMEVGSDSHAMAVGCLLMADLMHEVTSRATGELAIHYAQVYREGEYTEQLLRSALRLVPAALVVAAQQPGNAPLPKQYAPYFQQSVDLPADSSEWRSVVPRLACRAVCLCVCGAGGAEARGWWGGAAGRAGRTLGRLVAAYVSEPLVTALLDDLLRNRHELDSTEVTVTWSSREVAAVYEVEEREVELRVKFPAEYPLALPRVAASTAGARPAVTTTWIATYITQQNVSLVNAIRMWTNAVSDQVESAPQCYVCYCRLHPASGHPPAVPCHQCRNLYHTQCLVLHRWFASSHRAHCPLCRSAF